MLELTNEDFQRFVPFSKNVTEQTLQPFVKDALKMDVKPLLGALWDGVNAGTQTFTDSEGDDLVKAYWVVTAFERMVQVHGINVTQAGMTKSKGESYEQASDTERGRLQHYLRSKVNYYEGALRKQVTPLATPGNKRFVMGFHVVKK
jgi:hypothetical protein